MFEKDSEKVAVPHTYADWSSLLETLRQKSNDEEVLEAMKRGKLEWQSGVADRFAKKFAKVLNSRINDAIDVFQKNISRGYGRERVIVESIMKLRREFKFLQEATNISALPDLQRHQLRGLITEAADAVQKSLENSAKSDRSGKFASTIRNNRVNSF